MKSASYRRAKNKKPIHFSESEADPEGKIRDKIALIIECSTEEALKSNPQAYVNLADLVGRFSNAKMARGLLAKLDNDVKRREQILDVSIWSCFASKCVQEGL